MLTDVQCRKLKARERPYKVADERGLYLYVTTTGFRSWRFKYKLQGVEKRLTYGGYPEISLAEARATRDEDRRLLRAGKDPAIARKQREAELALSAEQTFRAVALAWHATQNATRAPRYAKQILQRLENDIFPAIGNVPIRDVTAAMVLRMIRAVEAREANDLAHRLRQYVSDIFLFAIASGWAEDDKAHVIRKAMVPAQKRLRPAVTKLAAARHVLEVTEARNVYAVTKLAARMLALTAARPGIVRLAAPAEFEDLDGPLPLWRIPAAKMKLTAERRIDATYEFVIPLSRQAVEVAKVAIELAGKNAPLLFPSVRMARSPLSDGTLSKFYRDAGFQNIHVPHGWRATFSTIMNERAADGEREDERAIIDMMLAHIRDGVEAAYNRAAYMRRRRTIAQEWADLLLKGACSAEQLLDGERGSSPRAARARRHDRRVARAPGPQPGEGFQRPAIGAR